MSNLSVESNLNISTQKQDVIKLLIFTIGKLTLALPILQVQKIVKQSEVHGSGLSYVNLTHLPEQEIAIIDLHQKLFGESLIQTESKGYFIISENIADEPLGIVVSEAPTLMDVPLEEIRLLPDVYRRADTLAIASHVALIPHQESTKTIFILDLNCLV